MYCTWADCPKEPKVRGYCHNHYNKALATGVISSTQKHSLSDIDSETMAATCAICGPTKIHTRGETGFRCGTSVKKYNSVIAKKASELSEEARQQQQRAAQLKRHSLTEDDFSQIFADQNGKCAICGITSDTLVVDHCHEKGNVRGLLCTHCNLALGHMKDNVASLLAAANYLMKTPYAIISNNPISSKVV